MHEHDSWLLIARDDLGIATVALRENYLNGCAYHTQQAAEKALKGYLAFKQHRLIRTHDLVVLLDVCATTYDASFNSLKSFIIFLQPYSTRSRYPDDYIEVEPEEAAEALQAATDVYNFVCAKIQTNT